MIRCMKCEADQILYSAIDVARALNVSTQRVRQLVDAGKLSAMRTPGGQRIFRREDVERLKAQRERA
jgi:excisionase family DNA binding protein